MKAIKLSVYQESANYKVPVSHDFRESYPLPPYSTIIGMVHYLCNFKKYHPMKVSIQGSYGSTLSDLYTEYEFKNGMKFEPSRHQINVQGLGISRGVAQVQLMTDVNMVLHIIPDDQTEVKYIFNCLKQPREYPNIGRREDLAVFKDVKVVDIIKQHLEEDLRSGKYLDKQKSARKNWAAYIPIELLENNDDIFHTDTHDTSLAAGTKYNLNKVYSLVKTRKNKPAIRRWERHEVVYTEFTFLEDTVITADSDGDAVFTV
ncbi:MAG: CRISPR-associated protein Cas5 [Liquorilactobacillus ghanensis]|uniref:CRISPR-associated protein Cas5 n=1 Tax=Liquorilactobacillus ghanensis TaxID=399370 RepID=UPI0039E95862